MANSADPDQVASSDRNQLILSYTVCKDGVYPGSAGQGLIISFICYMYMYIFTAKLGTFMQGFH